MNSQNTPQALMLLLTQLVQNQHSLLHLIEKNGIEIPDNLRQNFETTDTLLQAYVEPGKWRSEDSTELFLLAHQNHNGDGLILPYDDVLDALTQLQEHNATEMEFYANVWLIWEQQARELNNVHIYSGEGSFAFKEATFEQALPHTTRQPVLPVTTGGAAIGPSSMKLQHNGFLTLNWSGRQVQLHLPTVLKEAPIFTPRLVLIDESHIFRSNATS
ncbi:hypothetical protein [Deinococcus roseus]|uniref:Uncharacterized protein n=1 Tax=Deinococcus roseus TaxID=392414 RepID=A0ABQ2D388_9DEIO|nr:hypothetical protein [Deinococcus roseus]GGJ44237.1 hypothetical protein GCM10008938_33100 [Deinococcus roseus]